MDPAMKVVLSFVVLMAVASAPIICGATEGTDLDVVNQFMPGAATEQLAQQGSAPGESGPLHGRKLLTFFCGSTLCPFGQLCCNRVCTDVLSDPNNCLLCGKKCAPGIPCQKGLCGYGFFGIPFKK